MDVGIFLSCYNSENTIEDCINSILSQTFRGFSLYIFDDNSTDDTVKMISKIKDDRVKLICSDSNIGTYASKNFLLKKYGGLHKYIALQDADDISIKDRIQEQYDFLENSDELTACCGTNIIEFWEDGYTPHTVSKEKAVKNSRKNHYPVNVKRSILRDICNYLSSEDLYKDYMKVKICMNGSLMFKRSVLDELEGWDGNTHIAADTGIFLRILSKYKIFNLQEFLYKRRFSKSSLTASSNFGVSSDLRKSYNLKRSEIPKLSLAGVVQKENFFFPEFNFKIIDLKS